MPYNNLSVVKAPNIAALHSEGIAMPHSYVQRWCTPTRASLMTGRYPFRMGWNQYGETAKQRPDVKPGYGGFAEELSAVPLSFDILPKVLKRAGYATHMLGKWHLGHFSQAHTPAGRGFDTFFGFLFGSETHDSHNSWGRHTCSVPVIDLYNDFDIMLGRFSHAFPPAPPPPPTPCGVLYVVTPLVGS